MNKLFFIIVLVLSVIASVISGQSILERHKRQITLIYPKPGQTVGAVDSTFILGSVPEPINDEKYILFINDMYTKVHPDGGFIAFVPVTPGEFNFNLKAYRVSKKIYEHIEEKQKIDRTLISQTDILDSLTSVLTVNVPKPLVQIPFDSLVIDPNYRNSAEHDVYSNGDLLTVYFKGTPYCHAWFAVPGVSDSIPMAEIPPRSQPYWGEAVFGEGTVPDSLLVKGIYSGYLPITPEMRADSVKIKFFLKPPSADEMLQNFVFSPFLIDDITLSAFFKYTGSEIDSSVSRYTIAINDPQYPFTVRFIDSVQTIRHGTRMGYFSIFQPEGVEAFVIGEEGDWYIAKLSETQRAWISKVSVERLEKGILPPKSYLSVVRLESGTDKVQAAMALNGRHPFRVIEDDLNTIRLLLYGVTSNTDWIKYDFKDDYIDQANWTQIEPDLYQLTIKTSQPIWGYDSFYKGNTFYLQIKKPPENVTKLKGKRIVLDPGHSSDPGSTGPTGYIEADANLGIALELKKQLEKKGAVVIMTRSDNSNVDLYDRPVIAKLNNADIFVSIHNNALPDGVNPFVNNGSSTYYYHPHSISLAKSIQKELVKETKLGNYGLYQGNLAVIRPTQYPAVLVESAFMILPEQEAMLKAEDFRKKTAKAIVKGIENFLKEYEDD